MTFLQWTLAAIGASMMLAGLLVLAWVLAFICGRAFTLGRLHAGKKWNEMRRKNGRDHP